MKTSNDEIVSKIQQLWKEEAGIEFTIEETSELMSALSSFTDLLIEWHESSEDDLSAPINDEVDDMNIT